MAITPKASISPLFVNGATPNGSAFQNWIDSCLFLIGNDSTTELNTINEKTVGNGVIVDSCRLKDGGVSLLNQAAPAAPAATELLLFSNSADSDRLYTKNDSSEEKPVTPRQYLTVAINKNLFVTYANGFSIYLLITKKPIKITSIRYTLYGASPSGRVDIFKADNLGVNTIATKTLVIGSAYDIDTMTISNADVEADKIIFCGFTSGFGVGNTNEGCITIEYEEVS